MESQARIGLADHPQAALAEDLVSADRLRRLRRVPGRQGRGAGEGGVILSVRRALQRLVSGLVAVPRVVPHGGAFREGSFEWVKDPFSMFRMVSGGPQVAASVWEHLVPCHRPTEDPIAYDQES
jgi:hypothetical protein